MSTEHWGNCPHDGSTDDVLKSAREYHDRDDVTVGAVSWVMLEDGRLQTSVVGFQVYEDDECTKVITAENLAEDGCTDPEVMSRMSALAAIRACSFIQRELHAMDARGEL